VPPGSTAVLEVPTSEPDSVRETDAPAAGRPGVLGVEPSAAGVTLRLTSGRYTVSAIATGAEANQPVTAPSMQETR
jgi:alpha-L-rhamnosidase